MTFTKSKTFKAMIWVLFAMVGSGLCYPANVPNYPLEIIQPQPGQTTVDRYYKAYPGLVYNIRLAVIGGLYPFQFSLLEAPAGMTIDARGEITWPNPATSGSPHTVTARVVDQQPVAETVTWTITVTTDGFLFLDASASDGGTGTLDSPFNDITDWDKGNSSDKTYVGCFLYFKNGRYLVPKNNTNASLLLRGNKPSVWLAYPGHKPILDLTNNYIRDLGMVHPYFDGFEWNINGNTHGYMGQGSFSHLTFRRNLAHGIRGEFSENNAMVYTNSTSQCGLYWSIQDNECYGVRLGSFVLGYGGKKVLVEDNYVHDLDNHGVFPKQSNIMWFIRHNRFGDIDGNAINVFMSRTDDRPTSSDIDVSYNQIKKAGGSVSVNSRQMDPAGPVYMYRNSVYGNVNCYMITSTTGPFYFYDNVFVNGIREPNHIHTLNVNEPSRLIVTDNITGLPADGILDDNADLTPAYGQHLGLTGYQLRAGDTTAIRPVLGSIRHYTLQPGMAVYDVFGRKIPVSATNRTARFLTRTRTREFTSQVLFSSPGK